MLDGSDVLLIVVLGLIILAATGTWLTGQLAALFFRGAWPPVSIGQAMAAASRLPAHLDDPRQAWPPGVRHELPGPAGFLVAGATTLVILTGITVVLVQNGQRLRPHHGYASRAEIQAVLSEKAVIARGPVVRPSLGRQAR
jgi:hypothetical protein